MFVYLDRYRKIFSKKGLKLLLVLCDSLALRSGVVMVPLEEGGVSFAKSWASSTLFLPELMLVSIGTHGLTS